MALALGLGLVVAPGAHAAGPNTPANTLRMALHQFEVDHPGHFPADARQVMAEVVWAKDLFPPALRPELVVFDAKPGKGKVLLGPASSATDAKREATDPGALAYRFEAATQSWAIYQTVVEGGQAHQVRVVLAGEEGSL